MSTIYGAMLLAKFDRKPFMSKKHLANIRKLPSCISGRTPCEAHHLRVKDERGVAMKATDRWAVPLTPDEHREVHKVGSRMESKWFLERGVAAYGLATVLWEHRGDLDAMWQIVEDHRP